MRLDPNNPKQRVIVAIVNLDAVSDFHLASATAELYSIMADIESVNEMTILAPSNPDAYWHDGFGPLRPLFACGNLRHVLCSLHPTYLMVRRILDDRVKDRRARERFDVQRLALGSKSL